MKTIYKLLTGIGLGTVCGLACAADAIDYSSITGAVNVGTVAAAIVAMGVLKVGPNVAKWASNKLASFFK